MFFPVNSILKCLRTITWSWITRGIWLVFRGIFVFKYWSYNRDVCVFKLSIVEIEDIKICFTAPSNQNNILRVYDLMNGILMARELLSNIACPIINNQCQNTSVNWIIRLLLSFWCRPKVILLSGGQCIEILSPGTQQRTEHLPQLQCLCQCNLSDDQNSRELKRIKW